MTKREADNILRRMYRVLREGDTKVRFNRRMDDCGWLLVDHEGAEIHLNPDAEDRGGIVSTLLHELLHVVFFGEPEWKIRRREKALYRRLTDRQLANLMARAFQI